MTSKVVRLGRVVFSLFGRLAPVAGKTRKYALAEHVGDRNAKNHNSHYGTLPDTLAGSDPIRASN